MSLTLLLVECGVEIIPKKIRNHPAVRRHLNMKNYHSQLLDTSLHHTAMRKLKNFEKRGRPDILHLSLLNALGSPLNKAKKLKLLIHTINNQIFEFNPEIRIAKTYKRFKGLMAKLLIDQYIGYEDKSLIRALDDSLEDIVMEYDKEKIILMSRKGTLIKSYQDLFPSSQDEDYLIIIGGFQKGKFSNQIFNLSDKTISISKYPLYAWIVVSKVITYYEILHKIL